MHLWVPPPVLRRPVGVLLEAALLAPLAALLPLLVLVAALVSPWRRGWWRAPRLVAFALAYLVLDLGVVAACAALWVADGFGLRHRRDAGRRLAWEDRHYALMRWLLGTVVGLATRLFALRVRIEEPDDIPPVAALPDHQPHTPLVVLSRHAGPGDSFLIVHHLLSTYQRRPRIVMKAELQLDPGLDVLANRLPNAFIRPRPGADSGILARIAALAADVGPAGALLLFPEGGNATPHRRARALLKLRQLGRLQEARRARRLAHLLPPRPSGAVAAIDAAPGADVVFVAHTGLSRLGTVADLLRQVPMRRELRARWWRVPAAEVPGDDDERARWLYGWWAELDAWIDANQPGEPSVRVVSAGDAP